MTKSPKSHGGKKHSEKTGAGKDLHKASRHPGDAGLPDLAELDSQVGEKLMREGETSSALHVPSLPYRAATSDAIEAGQSGDSQGLADDESADSESIKELVDEGQDFEAMAVSGVENAPDPDRGEIRTKEVPEDDVPPEYRNYRENE
jgi:hypothetical protein